MALKETPSQTAGPFVHIGMLPATAGLKTGAPEQQNVLARDGSGDGLIKHLAVVPDANSVLQFGQPFELGLHLRVTDVVKQLRPVA